MKVCILAAGRGTRSYSNQIHKALLPLGNKAVISRIIEQFSSFRSPVDFVIALGHQGQLIKDFLLLAHPQLNFSFVEVLNYEGPGAGPGHSLWSCREFLQEPFFFTACDTLIAEKISEESVNWIGVQKVNDPQNWCSLQKTTQGLVREIKYKEQCDNPYAFVGIARVQDFKSFWVASEHAENAKGESQVINGLKALLEHNLFTKDLTWQDTGSRETYIEACGKFEKNFSFLGKQTEITYKYENLLIKYFKDKISAERRFVRGRELAGFVPPVHKYIGNFFSYEFVPGILFSKFLDSQKVTKFLNWAQENFWKIAQVDATEFNACLREFYLDKTLQRLSKFVDEVEMGREWESQSIKINGLVCLPVNLLLKKLEGEILLGAIASNFHGDLHEDNIVIADNSYALIDWRQDFGKLLNIGDRYYDLSKFLHVLEFSVDAMDEGRFNIEESSHEYSVTHECSEAQKQGIIELEAFCEKNGYSVDRVHLIDAIIFLNMAPLYEKNLAQYLYLYGRYKLQQCGIKYGHCK